MELIQEKALLMTYIITQLKKHGGKMPLANLLSSVNGVKQVQLAMVLSELEKEGVVTVDSENVYLGERDE